MRISNSYRIGVVLLTVVSASGCWVLSPATPGEKAREKLEISNNTFNIRVTAYPEENGGFVAGAYYTFESTRANADEWQKIMVFRHDDPVPIPRDQIRFLNDQIGYVFMGWMYAVTTDAGTTWSVWNAEDDLSDWQCCNYNLIQYVRIAPDGTGTMKLNPIPERRGEVPELYTKDFGRHWNTN